MLVDGIIPGFCIQICPQGVGARSVSPGTAMGDVQGRPPRKRSLPGRRHSPSLPSFRRGGGVRRFLAIQLEIATPSMAGKIGDLLRSLIPVGNHDLVCGSVALTACHGLFPESAP